MLAAQLKQPAVVRLLAQAGYPVEAPFSLEQLLRCLSRRLRQSEGFPHEIGVFLGYPLEDVIGFCRHKGEGCKLCGYWKVYGDVDHAKQCFAAFDRCRDALYARLRDAQVHRQDFSKIAQKALEDGALLVNPKAAGKQDILEILDNAY